MKYSGRKNRWIFAFLIGTVIFSFCACGDGSPKEAGSLGIALDDGTYAIEYSRENGYYVELPEGRPRVPQVVCEDGEVLQAFFKDGDKTAKATVSLNGETYEIAFKKDRKLGFQLQFGDRYTFIPKTLEPSYFVTSNQEVAEVDQNGVITITGVSDEAVIIKAGQGINEESFVIDKTIRAPISIYLLTGQSNAAYYYADPAKAVNTKQGTAYQYDQVEGGGVIRSMNNGDGTMAVGSIEASLCKSLYSSLGEKILVINAGISGQGLDTFLPFDSVSYVKVEDIWRNATGQIVSEDFTDKFEPRLRSYIWVQGESDDWTNTEKYLQEYYGLHQVLVSKEYYNLDYGFIVMVRSKFSRPCDAQEQLVQAYEDIIMASRSAQYFSVEGGTMQGDDLHYSQEGDNILGKEAGETIAKVYKYGISSVPEGE